MAAIGRNVSSLLVTPGSPLFAIRHPEAVSLLPAKRRREKRSSFDDGEMPSRSSSAVRLISSGSRADQHPGHVSSFLNC